MKRDRLRVVLHVRELVERRRLAERVAAEQTLHLAGLRREAAERARDTPAAMPDGDGGLGAMQLHRLGGVALSEAAEAAAGAQAAAARDVAAATGRYVEAAVAHRSVERLAERRRTEAATQAAKAAERQLDAVALETWRRRS